MSVSVMQAQPADLRMTVTRLTTPTVGATPDTSANKDESAAMPTVTSDSSDLDTAVNDKQGQLSHPGILASWADMAELAENNPNEWIISKKKTSQPKIRVKGVKNDGAQVKAVPRKPILAAYVGRLHIDTTPEDLSKYLTEQGMRGVVCRKLKPKDGQTFKAAAFFVSCCEESKHFKSSQIKFIKQQRA